MTRDSFNEKPFPKAVYWVIGLSLASLFVPLLGVLNGFLHQVFDPISINNSVTRLPMGFVGVALAIFLSAYAIIISVRVYRQGVRTWLLWVGFFPALLITLFWMFMIIGELVFPH